ncbi:MAG: hypothetical protein ACPGQL_07895 [Thermoplasmatota archaeon]
MRTAVMLLLVSGLVLAAAPPAEAIPPVCIPWPVFGEIHEQVGPVVVESYGVNCSDVRVEGV